MAERSHVPKFGNWEMKEDVPYTAYFDKARKVRPGGGKMINPNDLQENTDLSSDSGAPSQAPPSRVRPKTDELAGHGPARSPHRRPRSMGENDLKQFAEFPAHQENMRRRASEDQNNQQLGGRGARPVRVSGGSENNSERSPLHHQARTPGRSVAAPSSFGDGSKGSHDGHGTPGRSRPRPLPRADESPDRGAAVPKFGDWDENNPASADGYTHIFNKVREERNYGGPNPGTPRTPTRSDARKAPPSDSAKSCCFCFGTK